MKTIGSIKEGSNRKPVQSDAAVLFNSLISAGRWFGNLLLLLFFSACVDPYIPPTTVQNYAYLVVDGILNTADTSFFSLSRTQLVSSTDSIHLEIGAAVFIQEENGNSYRTVLGPNGRYVFYPGQVDGTKNIRIHIITSDGNEYDSEYVPVLPNPPIDSLSWRLTTLDGVYGVQLYANTHDFSNLAKYFLWRYDETWKFSSKYTSSLIAVDSMLVYRTADQQIDVCYTNHSSTEVLVTASTNLNENSITGFPLLHIALTNGRLQYRYSMFLHQYAISEEAYYFWTSIRNNTEDLGSIFGTLPVRITGNLTCITNPSQAVIGFFSATNTSGTRIFISSDQLPRHETQDPFYNGCDIVYETPDPSQPTTELYLYPTQFGVAVTDPRCADCRLHNGTLKPPPFW